MQWRRLQQRQRRPPSREAPPDLPWPSDSLLLHPLIVSGSGGGGSLEGLDLLLEGELLLVRGGQVPAGAPGAIGVTVGAVEEALEALDLGTEPGGLALGLVEKVIKS